MPKFGKIWFNGYYFGDDVPAKGYFGKSIRRIPLGTFVRKQLGKRVIFQTVRGNGYYGSVQGKEYQTIKKYFVPSSINNAEGQHARDVFTAAIAAWQGLAAATKIWWNNEVKRLRLVMSGYNLYIRTYMKDNL